MCFSYLSESVDSLRSNHIAEESDRSSRSKRGISSSYHLQGGVLALWWPEAALDAERSICDA